MSGCIIRQGKAYVVVLDYGKDDRGIRKRKWRSFKTRREAEVFQAQAATHPALGAGIGLYGSSRLRLKDFLDRWLTDYAEKRVRPSTQKRYGELVRVHLAPGIGHVQLSRLSPQAIETFYGSLHGRVSSTTISHVANLLSQALKHAVRWGLILQNPADQTEKPKRERSEPAVWTFEQTLRFVAGTEGSEFRLLYALFLATGLRLGEALSLTWQDIDLSRGVLIVRTGKTPNARRAVLLPAGLVERLRRVRGVGPVFAGVNPWTLRRHLYRLTKKLGLPRMRIHDLRHVHATLLLSEGTDLASISARLGHSNKAFTLRTYAHALASGQERAAEVSDRILSNPSLTQTEEPDTGIAIPVAGKPG